MDGKIWVFNHENTYGTLHYHSHQVKWGRSVYGHVAFVEQVKSDGSILISESNFKGLGIVSYRTFDAETAKQFTYPCYWTLERIIIWMHYNK